MTLPCRIAALPGRPGDRHRARCLRCQARIARGRTLERALRSMRAEVVPAPAGLHRGVLRRLPRQDALQPRRRVVLRTLARQAAAAGVTAATGAAVFTGVVRWRSRPLG